jgi:hypothetical protein
LGAHISISNRIREKLAAAGTNQKLSETVLKAYFVFAYGLLGLLLLGIVGVVGILGLFLLAETWDSPSAMLLFVDFAIGIVLLVTLSSERFRDDSKAFILKAFRAI